MTIKLPINFVALPFAVSICKCSSENSCFIEIHREHSWPTAGQAIGILLAVLIVIGKSVLGWFEARLLKYDGAAASLTPIHLLGRDLSCMLQNE